MSGIEYEEITYEEYAAYTGHVKSRSQDIFMPMTITIQDGHIREVYLESSVFSYGIRYDLPTPDSNLEWDEEHLNMSAEEILDTYYTLVRSEQADVAEAEGLETISVYAGDSGDGEGGYVLVHGANGKLLGSMYAGWSRVDWDNIYLGKRDGTSLLMTVHIEDRYDMGNYTYHVFRLDEEGGLIPVAGSFFGFGDSFLYDDDLFRRWADEMTGWLEDSSVLLSTQDMELRTDPVSDADRYNYDTLSGSPRGAAERREGQEAVR